MHELALTEGILDIVESEAKKHGFTVVQEIRIKVGEFSGVIPECIREFFPIAAKGTAAETAELIIEPVNAEFRCEACGYVGMPDKKDHCCASCGSSAVKMVKGREFYIDSLKVE